MSDNSRLFSTAKSLRGRNNREPGWQFKSPSTAVKFPNSHKTKWRQTKFSSDS